MSLASHSTNYAANAAVLRVVVVVVVGVGGAGEKIKVTAPESVRMGDYISRDQCEKPPPQKKKT